MVIEKSYSPAAVEARWQEAWKESRLFESSVPCDRKPYSILMPPPNVTGILHLGHVLNISIQDIYIRWRRLQGHEVCWFPGLDHAGIATQSRVEAELKKEGVSRHDLGRSDFISRVWEWKEQFGGIILEQLRRLGVSCDWSKTLFTMDEGPSSAVREVFIRLFDEGLVYRGTRIINWSPMALSALSDEEVIFREVREKIYTLRYQIVGTDDYLLLSTVRPETIFADVAVAVNPSDDRYKHLVGTSVIVPLAGRSIPVIADGYADPAFGTGCVKITPAHDPNDYEVGLRHNLPMPSCIDPDARLNSMAGEFAGMDRFVARKKIVGALESAELLEATEDYTHNVGFSERGDEAVEPMLSDQWFVRMAPLAAPALESVRSGDVRFYPDHWVKTYQHWMTNVRDWCISRQLWWGHRIPVFYADDGTFTAARSEDHAREKLGLGSDVQLRQDQDVLDTWFSSWLWPLTTMGWCGEPVDSPNDKFRAEGEYFLPTNLLVTGPDIIFFWVARMIMASTHFGGVIPFRDVYFTSIIRDSKGKKLSKSLGNSPDPLQILDRYGADAVRFTIIYLAPLGVDVRLDINEKTQDIASMEIGRNFANKLWNAARFLQMKKATPPEVGGSTPYDLSSADVWIRSRLHSTIQSATEALDSYRITEYARTLYEFVWRDFCDWYVEIVKVQAAACVDSFQYSQHMQYVFGIFEDTLKLLHPVMPFITEELWHSLYDRSEQESIGVSGIPICDTSMIDPETEKQFSLQQQVVEAVRRMRSTLNIPPSENLPLSIRADSNTMEFLRSQSAVTASLCKLSSVVIGPHVTRPAGSAVDVVGSVELFLDVSGTIDTEREAERLRKEVERLASQIAVLERKLSNDGFLGGAKADVVEMEKKKLSDWRTTVEKLTINISSLENA